MVISSIDQSSSQKWVRFHQCSKIKTNLRAIPSVDDYKEQQENEIAALQSIYPDEFTQLGADGGDAAQQQPWYRIRIRASGTAPHEIADSEDGENHGLGAECTRISNDFEF